MKSKAKMVACQSLPVVYLWQPAILDIHTCKLHHSFYFTVLFEIRYHSVKACVKDFFNLPPKWGLKMFNYKQFLVITCFNSKVKENKWPNEQMCISDFSPVQISRLSKLYNWSILTGYSFDQGCCRNLF